MLLGIAYRSVGSPDLMGETVAEFRQALALNPDFVPARFYLAHVYLDLGRAGRAREELETALTKHPGQPQFLALLGEAERQLGNPRRSMEVNRQALQADPSFVQARYYLGLALFDLGQREEAIQELERVVQSGPKIADAYISLGGAYLEAGRLDDALTTLLQASRIDPSRPEIRISLSRAYRSKGLLDKAEEQLKFSMPERSVTQASPVYQQVQSDLLPGAGPSQIAAGAARCGGRGVPESAEHRSEPRARPTATWRKSICSRVSTRSPSSTRREPRNLASRCRRTSASCFRTNFARRKREGASDRAQMARAAGVPSVSRRCSRARRASRDASRRAAPCAFADVTARAKIDFVHKSGASPEKYMVETFGSGVAWIDYDNDGFPDLYFVNGAPGRRERPLPQQQGRHVHGRDPAGRSGRQGASATRPASPSGTTTTTAISIST